MISCVCVYVYTMIYRKVTALHILYIESNSRTVLLNKRTNERMHVQSTYVLLYKFNLDVADDDSLLIWKWNCAHILHLYIIIYKAIRIYLYIRSKGFVRRCVYIGRKWLEAVDTRAPNERLIVVPGCVSYMPSECLMSLRWTHRRHVRG